MGGSGRLWEALGVFGYITCLTAAFGQVTHSRQPKLGTFWTLGYVFGLFWHGMRLACTRAWPNGRPQMGEQMILYPGKFEGELHATRAVYDMAGDGFIEDCGDVQTCGWYARYSGPIRGRGPFHVIISEDSQGFVHGEYFESQEEFDAAWAEVEEHCAEFDNAEEF